MHAFKLIFAAILAGAVSAQSCDFSAGSCASLSCQSGTTAECVEDHGTGGGQCQCLTVFQKRQACDFSSGSCAGFSCPAGTSAFCEPDHGTGGGECQCLSTPGRRGAMFKA